MNDELLVSFLYLLLRDSLPFGEVERIMRDIEVAAHAGDPKNFTYSSAPHEAYARALADRLTGRAHPPLGSGPFLGP